MPLGGIGEICIGRPSVARGYLRREELTAQKFIDSADGEGRLYRCGDLGRFLPNGEIEFLGRNDFQVKVRGYRIEIAEVEQTIASQPEVDGVCIGTHAHQGSVALVAWYSGRGLSPAELRGRLETQLAAYTIPAFFVPVDAWPLTLNGKIDRPRLPAPALAVPKPAARELDALECIVRSAWARTLGTADEAIGTASHFFEAGGHSRLATQAWARIGAALSVSVKPALLLTHPRFDDFCRALRSAAASAADALPPLTHAVSAAESVPVKSGIVQAMHHRASFDRSDNTYNIVVRVDFSREVHPLELHAALRRVFARDPLFASTLADVGGELHLMRTATDAPLIRIESATQASIHAQLEAWRAAPIAPDEAPCWRALAARYR